MIPALSSADEALLAAAPLFSAIRRDTLLSLVAGAQVVERPAGGLLFAAGDPADRFFLVLAGRVDLFALTAGGDRSIIEVIEAGQTFAEAAMFADADFPLTAETVAGTRLLEIPARPFLARLAGDGDLAARLLAGLAGWQRHLRREIAALKGRTPAQRLGLYLLGLSLREAEGGADAVALPLSKADLASRLGIAPESLSRALVRLRSLGVATKGRQVRIDDVARLRAFCGEP